MRISLTEAEANLEQLVELAEAGHEVILTREGQAVAQLVPVKRRLDRAERRAVLERFSREAERAISPGASAARSQDFLYNEYDGLPRSS
jgi:prevent-host-death family protein